MQKEKIILFFLFCAFSAFGQLKTYSFPEVENQNKTVPKPTLVFIHTTWCKYCKMMQNSTFKNQEVLRLLNEDFYFIALDAEEKSPVTFLNKTFVFKPTGNGTGVHELATELATINGEMVYPAIIVLGSNYTILFQKHSYLDSKELKAILSKFK